MTEIISIQCRGPDVGFLLLHHLVYLLRQVGQVHHLLLYCTRGVVNFRSPGAQSQPLKLVTQPHVEFIVEVVGGEGRVEHLRLNV